MVTESWFRNLWKIPRRQDGISEKVEIGVLAFEVASLMSKLVHLWQCLSDKQVFRLREEITNSVGIKKLVSEDEEYIGRLICAEMVENVTHVAKSVARLVKKCNDPGLKSFELAFTELIHNGVDPYGWIFSLKKMERKVKKMERFISVNATLYQEMELLADLEQTLKRMKSGDSAQESWLEFHKKVMLKQHEVKSLRASSLWNKTYDYTIRLLARSIFTIFSRIKHVFGFEHKVDVGDSKVMDSDFMHRSQSVSALMHASVRPTENTSLPRFSSGPLGIFTDTKKSLTTSLSSTMAAATSNSALPKLSTLTSSFKSSIPISKSSLPFSTTPQKPTPYRSFDVSCSLSHASSNPRSAAASVTQKTAPPHYFISRYADDEPRKGADILVEALEREGVKDVFAYPGGASMEIHQALTRSKIIRNVLPRHEQGGVFAAEGYARSSGISGVCIATSGPGATNLVSGLADAMLDSIPLVAITGQVPRRMIGTDAFQETPIVEVTRSITKHNYLVLDVDDIPRIVSEAFFLASSGRPGPVLIDVPKDIQQQLAVPKWNHSLRLPGYLSRLPKAPAEAHLEQIVRLVSESKKPVLYVGGGCLNSSEELKRFVELTGIPVASTLMGLGAFPISDELSLQMLGMHGTVYANYAVDKSDLLLAFGVRFDDRVTGKLEAFASRAKIVHIDIDSAEIGKNKQPHMSVCSDVKLALQGINKILETTGAKLNLDYSEWRQELNEQKLKFPLSYKTFGEAIPPQYAIQVLDELTGGNAIISTGVGQHQMWAAQFYKYKKPRQWLTSGGLGAMGFGLPAAIGAAVANPEAVVVDIDGDGSFIMNVQELATIRVENLPVKILLLNNQHLGMVVQWEDRFYKANRAHTYLGDPSNESEIFPNMLKFAEACGIPAARVTKKEDLKAAIQKMLDTPGPYLLDVIVPHQEHVLPMIPSGGAFKDVITEGDGRTQY